MKVIATTQRAQLGVTKLATRVSELKKVGYKFDQEWERSYNRYGKPVRYMRYRLVAE